MNREESRTMEGRVETKVKVATLVTTALGIVLAVSMMILGCFLTWRSDSVLGLYTESGWHYANLVSGDGKILLALGATCFIFLVLGAWRGKRAFFGIVFLCSVVALLLSSYEIIFLLTRPGITGPGTGLYIALLASVAGMLAGQCGYSLLKSEPEARKET
ncbi:MAG: hypothetical protein KKB90_09255 [Actinobacteria bacterium]|nr:hypothetical protein [Actinomycetota bacterium]MCG2817505.1 hypothetical protein [Actinomycetes bacterium]MBU4219128.1 hypothetical protein [Actinomycetota bacterium]MBU4358415.1 hypothetical protein [Actinomycetota bacterium]MBU4392861.1 hypothetical protein [Actinomycetota bacterium]